MLLIKYVEQFLYQINGLNNRQLFIYAMMTLVVMTAAILISLWFMTLWSGSQVQMVAKFVLCYALIMVRYFRFSYWLTA